MFCIGVPAKAILTGTITFGLPLLLGQYGYRQEEIGQIIMLYAIGVVAASGYVSRVVDRTGSHTAVAAQDKPASKWFRYGSGIDAAWTVSADPTTPLQLSIRRKGREQMASSKRVLVMYPRPSSAYDIAITKMLQVLEAKDIDTGVTVVNFQMDDVQGRAETLQFAERNKFDLIFAMGSESTAWLFDNYKGGAIPVVSVCSKDPVSWGKSRTTRAAAATISHLPRSTYRSRCKWLM